MFEFADGMMGFFKSGVVVALIDIDIASVMLLCISLSKASSP